MAVFRLCAKLGTKFYHHLLAPTLSQFAEELCRLTYDRILHLEEDRTCYVLSEAVTKSLAFLERFIPLLSCKRFDLCTSDEIAMIGTDENVINSPAECEECSSTLAIIKMKIAEKILEKKHLFCTFLKVLFQNKVGCNFLQMTNSPVMVVEFINNIFRIVDLDEKICPLCYHHQLGEENIRMERDIPWEIMEAFQNLFIKDLNTASGFPVYQKGNNDEN